jgi:hypothetical protein
MPKRKMQLDALKALLPNQHKPRKRWKTRNARSKKQLKS